MFTEKIHKIVLSDSDDKRIQSIDCNQTYSYEATKDIIYKSEEIKFNNVINNNNKQYTQNNFDDLTERNTKEHNPNWSQISEHPYRILIIRESGSGRTKTLLNLINRQ